MAATAVPLFRCPSRPGDPTQPTANEINYFNAPNVGLTNRIDYAINQGDWVSNSGMGPPKVSTSGLRNYNWIDADRVTGVSWERGSTRLPEIAHGTAYTFLIGEKRVSFLGYGTSADNGHNQSMFSGVDLNTARWTHLPPVADRIELDAIERRFGAAHASKFHLSICDTSIRFVNYASRRNLTANIADALTDCIVIQGRDRNPKIFPLQSNRNSIFAVACCSDWQQKHGHSFFTKT